ncbi:MAG TPA: hypothetical protein VMJ73_11745 [Rhizomicrobium sp.]|nr:hypothetical protein [Rhizomicrobium sp.]
MTLQSIAAPLFAVGLMVSTAAAYAQDEEPSSTGCLHMADQVKSAFRANATSTNIDKASEERRDAAEACRLGYYKLGIYHYKKALELLSAG